MVATLDPTLITHLQDDFIIALSGLYAHFVEIAKKLFYGLAGLEVVLFGLAWAVKQDEAIGAFVFKILKLGIIFFLITSYPTLLKHLIDGFIVISKHSVQSTDSSNFLFNPALIWQMGFSYGLTLLKLAVHYGGGNVGMSIIYIVLGFGLLLMFGLMGAIVTLLVVGFYLISLTALILLPFGALSISKLFLTRALSAVMQMSVRIFVLVLILAVGFAAFTSWQVKEFSLSTPMMQPVVFFFAVMVLFILALKVPSWAAKAVGEFGGSIFDDLKASPAPVSSSTMIAGGSTSIDVNAAQNPASVQSVAFAANINATQSAATGMHASQAASVQSTSVSVSQAGSSVSPTSANLLSKYGKTDKATEIGISKESLGKLKATFKQAIKESNKS